MALSAGTRLGPYEILAPIGAGGMGEVYRAHDTRLGREVAVKVLPASVANDPQRVQRFELEARATSNLNHPNILAIYDVGNKDGIFYLVSELLEGASLRNRMVEAPLPVRKVIDCAIQIAYGLAAAHSKGFIHRDIKPENIFITKDGRIKILDFGLAKVMTKASVTEETQTTSMATEAGSVLGTAGYMSPEQVRAQTVDHRSDIFSYGAVLYEMLAGRKAFGGALSIETMNAILNDEPPQLPGTIPPVLARIVWRCLEKKADERFQSAYDLAFALESLSGASEKGGQIAMGVETRPRPKWIAGLALLLLVGAAGAIGWRFLAHSPAAVPTTLTLRKITFDSGLTTDPAISSDGKLLAFASDRSGEGHLDIYVQQIDGGAPIRITQHEADDSEPSFSPDGTRLVFRSERDQGGIYIAPALGGDAQLIVREGHNPRFSPDGKWIAYWDGVILGEQLASRLFVVSTAGGKPRSVQPSFVSASHPSWTPKGTHILFWGRKSSPLAPAPSGAAPPAPPEPLEWWITDLSGGEAVNTAAIKTMQGLPTGNRRIPTLSPDGQFVFFSTEAADNSNLFRVPFSGKTWHVSGPLEQLTLGSALESQPSFSAGSRLVFSSAHLSVDLWSLPIDGNTGRVSGEMVQLTHDEAREWGAALSADGKILAYRSKRSGADGIWVKNLANGKDYALTPATVSGLSGPVLLSDGSKVIHGAREGDSLVVYASPVFGGLPERICEKCPTNFFWDVSLDAKYTLHQAGGVVNVIENALATNYVLARHREYRLYNHYFSPDGKWVAFEARNKPDRNRLHIVPFRVGTEIPESEWITVTDGSFFDDKPRWSPDGNLLYFVSNRDGFLCIWAIRLDSVSKKPVGEPFPVQHFHRQRRSLVNAGILDLMVPVAKDKLVFGLGERTGNIWLGEFKTR